MITVAKNIGLLTEGAFLTPVTGGGGGVTQYITKYVDKIKPKPTVRLDYVSVSLPQKIVVSEKEFC